MSNQLDFRASHKRWLAIVFVGSVLVTSLFWLIMPSTFLVNESSDYRDFYEPVARRLLGGHGLTTFEGYPAVRYPPGFPLLLAGLFWLSRVLNVSEPVVLSGFTLLCVGGASGFIFMLGRSVFGSRPAVISGLAWASYPLALWLTKQPNSEIPFMFLLVAGFYLFWRGLLLKGHWRSIFFLSGCLVGCAMLIRPIAIGVGFVMAGSLWLVGSEISVRSRLLLILTLLLGNLVVIILWEAWVFSVTGEVILLSTGGRSSILDGLTFAGVSKGYRQMIYVPKDVAALMEDFLALPAESKSLGGLVSAVVGETLERPLVIVKLFGLKVIRSWYGTDSNRFESEIMIVQILYLVPIVWGSWAAWRQGGDARKLGISVWLMVLYFWAMTIVSLSIVRYLVPAIGLLFVLLPAPFSSARTVEPKPA